jgi:2-keto-4-pentenoate hydratase
MRRLLLACVFALPALAAQAACPPDAAVAAYAEGLISGQKVEPFTGLTMEDAACARDKLIPLLARAWGAPVGYKAGATGQAVQQRYALPGPVWGVMFERTLSLHDGAEVALTPEIAGIGVEADLLVRVRDDGINTAGRDHVEILRHLDQVIPFIELPRGGTTRAPDGPGLVAGNVSARLGVMGAPLPVPATAEFAARLGAMNVFLSDDTQEIAHAQGSALLGHPLNVIPWLVEDLARSGRKLKAGDIVSLGGFAASVPPQAGRTYTVRYAGMADLPVTVSVRFR